jgi:hypothetical protein
MAGDETGLRWWIRYVVIPLIGGGGIVGLWLALSQKPSPPGPDTNAPQETSEPDQRAQVEKVVSQYLAAWMDGNTDAFISLVSEPFYFDQRIILTKPALRAAYDSLKMEKGSTWHELQVTRIKVMTAKELQDTGYDLSRDRVFRSLNLTLDDYAVQVFLSSQGREEGLLVVVRRGPPLQIVGTWD